jgi:serine incorporator 1/3
VLLLILSVAIAFAFQFGVAPYIVEITISNYVTDAWLDGCEGYETAALIERCAGQAGVYRSAASAVLFFTLAAIAVMCKRTANRVAWPAKYVLFLFLVLATCFIPNDPLFSSIYLNVARIGGIFFIVFQQVVFVDMAHNWNDGWVEKADNAESEQPGSGKKWLIAILICVVFLFAASMVGWGLLFHYFRDCSTNMAFIVVTVVLCILVTAAQLSGTEGSLLASSLISAYATMLCYNAVTKNPNGVCNPQLGGDDVLSIVIGVGLTVVSMGYVGWSTTADATLSRGNEGDDEAAGEQAAVSSSTKVEKEKSTVGGVVTNYQSTNAEDAGGDEGEDAEETEGDVPNTFSNNWKLNVALVLITCWFSMALTGWGSIQADGTVANPQVGEINMWIIISSQWFAMLLYSWTLVAPRIFPDRDFS